MTDKKVTEKDSKETIIADKTVKTDAKDAVIVEKKDKKTEKELTALDKFHAKHNAVSFLEPLSIFKYYLLDLEGLKAGNLNDIAKRGIIVVKDQVEWYKLIRKNEKLLFGFRCLKGVQINQRYRVTWNRVCDAARKLDK